MEKPKIPKFRGEIKKHTKEDIWYDNKIEFLVGTKIPVQWVSIKENGTFVPYYISASDMLEAEINKCILYNSDMKEYYISEGKNYLADRYADRVKIFTEYKSNKFVSQSNKDNDLQNILNQIDSIKNQLSDLKTKLDNLNK